MSCESISRKRKNEGEEENHNASKLLIECSQDRASSVTFSNDFAKRDFRLIEVNEEILKTVNIGHHIRIIGERKREAVLCTSSKTYSIKKVETSNTILLIPPSKDNNFHVSGICSDYYELKPIFGKVDLLQDLLKPSEYKGMTEEVNNPPTPESLLTLLHLQRTIQASVTELDDALKKHNIVEINGYIRLLSRSAVFEYAEALFNQLIENDWAIGNLDEDLCMRGMPRDTDVLILRRVLSSLGERMEDEGSHRACWSLDKDKVLRLSAQIVFTRQAMSASPTEAVLIEVGDFLQRWSNQSPVSDQLEPLADTLLRGIALKVSGDLGPNSKAATSYFYRYLPVETMSKEVAGRLQQLFTAQSRLTLQQIEPYLEDIVAADKRQETLLQHCRVIDNLYIRK
eukprot:gene30394-39634_t